MAINKIFSFLVRPEKGEEEQTLIRGAEIPATSAAIFTRLRNIYRDSHEECDIEILFKFDESGSQGNNLTENTLREFARDPSEDTGREIASLLQAVTTRRSGLGLLFVVHAQVDNNHQVLLLRYPAEEAFTAEMGSNALRVELIEQAFFKNRRFKAAFFETSSLEMGFRSGIAADKQLNDRREISEYWIDAFLQASLKVTSQWGTKRLAKALSGAIKTASVEIKQELISVGVLLRQQDGRARTTNHLLNMLSISDEAKSAIKNNFEKESLLEQTFTFSGTVFSNFIKYRWIELHNGAIVSSLDNKFEEVFTVEETGENTYRFSTEGVVTDQKLRRTK